MIKNRRRPKHAVDTERIKIIRCKNCRQKITFSNNTVEGDGLRIPCNLDGTKHVDEANGGLR